MHDSPGSAVANGHRDVVPTTLTELWRGRFMHATALVSMEEDLARITVARIVARAGGTRRAFYGLFRGRDDCVQSTVEDAMGRAVALARDHCSTKREWRDRIRVGLAAMLAFFDERPELAWLCFVTTPLGRSEQPVAVLRSLVDDVRATSAHQPPSLMSDVVVGGTLAVITRHVAQASSTPLSTLLNPLMATIVFPFFGAAQAEYELRAPQGDGKISDRVRAPCLSHRRDTKPLKRMTDRTLTTLLVVEKQPGMSNRAVALAAGISDEGQASKLLARLERLELIQNANVIHRGEPNAWSITGGGIALLRGDSL